MYDKLKLLYPRMRGTPDISGYLDKAKEQTDLKTGEVCIFGSLDGLKVSIYTGGYSNYRQFGKIPVSKQCLPT